MLLVGYDVPVVQVMYLDEVLMEHTSSNSIVKRLYDVGKTYGLIVDCCGITKALAIFEEDDIKEALEPSDKLNYIRSKK